MELTINTKNGKDKQHDQMDQRLEIPKNTY